MTIYELSDLVEAHIVIIRHHNQDGRWSCKLEHCEFKTDAQSGILISEHGDGPTVHESIVDYVNAIRGKVLVKNAMSKERFELRVPVSIEA